MPDEAEYQPQNSLFQAKLMPDTLTAVTLSGGRTIPHHYYLGPNNLVPFIKLESPTANKEFSWGEVITIQPGVNVQVRSASYMPADLQIQSGTVPGQIPGRITVPVEVTVTGLPMNPNLTSTQLTIAPQFPCDTRRAKRAWFSVDHLTLADGQGVGGNNAATISVRASINGYLVQHSTALTPSGVPEPAAFTGDVLVLQDDPAGQQMIPLGVSLEGNAMKLADKTEVIVDILYDNGAAKWMEGSTPIAGQYLLTGICSYILEY